MAAYNSDYYDKSLKLLTYYEPESFLRLPNSQENRLVYLFKSEVMKVENSKNQIVNLGWTFFGLNRREYDRVVSVDMTPKTLQFSLNDYKTENRFYYSVLLSLRIKVKAINSSSFALIIKNGDEEIENLKIAIQKPLDNFIKSKTSEYIESFDSKGYEELSLAIMELNNSTDSLSFTIVEVQNITFDMMNKEAKKKYENIAIAIGLAEVELKKFEAESINAKAKREVEKEAAISTIEHQKELQERQNKIDQLKFELEKIRIVGGNTIELEKQEKLIELENKRRKAEQDSAIDLLNSKIALYKDDPDTLKLIDSDLYATLKKYDSSELSLEVFKEATKFTFSAMQNINKSTITHEHINSKK
ncbi:MAG: hypothetical protein KBB37_07215 [Bacteroidia bacterium]|nr:hypothetical protein [Bacteroidia bacterium]MBP7261059.1 hypothetical protein [Bacteroidia bacterium]MBP9178984.1 hypothetical protein [Bacteroidia bacterium]